MKKNKLIKIIAIAGTCAITGLISINSAAAYFTVTLPNGQVGHFKYDSRPGDTINDSIIIINVSDGPTTLRLYGADGTKTNQGTFTIKNEKDPQNTIGKWLTFTNPLMELKANEKIEIPFTINIPKNLPPGAYGGGIAVETIAEKKFTEGSTSLSVVSRFATRVMIVIAGDKLHKPEWKDFSYGLTAQGSHQFELTFENKGNSNVIIESTIEILGAPDGNNPEEDPEKIQDESLKLALIRDKNKNIIRVSNVELYQGEKISLENKWLKKPWFGTYTAKATVTFHEYDIISGKKINPQTMTKEITFTVIRIEIFMYMAGFIVVIISLAILRSLSFARIRKRSKPYTVGPRDSLETLAKEGDISWKKLAKINKLHPPYSLKEGQKILLPPKK